MTDAGDDDEPIPHKDTTIGFRVPREVANAARKRAGKRGLGAVLRAWLFGYSIGEFPEPPAMDDSRAPQRPSKRKPKPKKTD